MEEKIYAARGNFHGLRFKERQEGDLCHRAFVIFVLFEFYAVKESSQKRTIFGVCTVGATGPPGYGRLSRWTGGEFHLLSKQKRRAGERWGRLDELTECDGRVVTAGDSEAGRLEAPLVPWRKSPALCRGISTGCARTRGKGRALYPMVLSCLDNAGARGHHNTPKNHV
jgi:hypothetical protein